MELNIDDLRIGEDVTFDDPVIQTFKRTIDSIFNFLIFFIDCDPSLFERYNQYDQYEPERYHMLMFFASRNRRQLANFAYEIGIFIDCLKHDYYNQSMGNPMLYFNDFFLHANDQDNFFVLFKLNNTFYMYNSKFRVFYRRNTTFY